MTSNSASSPQYSPQHSPLKKQKNDKEKSGINRHADLFICLNRDRIDIVLLYFRFYLEQIAFDLQLDYLKELIELAMRGKMRELDPADMLLNDANSNKRNS